MMQKPLVAITMGDPAGVGPETIVGAWADPVFHDHCRAVVVGHPEILRRAAGLLAADVTIVEVGSPGEVEPASRTLPCLAAVADEALEIRPATVDPRAGQAAYDALVAAVELALAGRVDAVTTAPLNKWSLHAAGHSYPGHTELLAERCGADDVAMMLYLAPGEWVRGRAGLGVVHVTLHTALGDVCRRLTHQGILVKARLADAAMRAMLPEVGLDRPPRIGVCALNPHAGEQGLFGDEEERIILPAVEQALAEDISIVGPLPADTLLVRAAAGDFDAVVAMYHDQGHIPLKLLGMHRAVNITLGLPIVRTSVAHGTAFDLAWQGRAETSSMLEAVRVASQLARQRTRVKTEDRRPKTED